MLDELEDEVEVKFLKKVGRDTFSFNDVHDDIAMVAKEDIVRKLSEPVINNRGTYKFVFKEIARFNL